MAVEQLHDFGSMRDVIEEGRRQGRIQGARIFHESPDKFADALTDEILKDLNFLCGSLNKSITYLYHAKYFDQFEEYLKMFVPVDTGTLRSSIKSDIPRGNIKVSSRKITIVDNPYPSVDGSVWRYATDVFMMQDQGYQPHWVGGKYIGASSQYNCGKKALYVSRFTPFLQFSLDLTFDNWAGIREDAEKMYNDIAEARKGRTKIIIDKPWERTPPEMEMIHRLLIAKFGEDSGIVSWNSKTGQYDIDFKFAINQKIKNKQKWLRGFKHAKDKRQFLKEFITFKGIKQWEQINKKMQKFEWLRRRNEITNRYTGAKRGKALYELGRLKEFNNFGYMPLDWFVPPSLNSKVKGKVSAATVSSHYAQQFKQKVK